MDGDRIHSQLVPPDPPLAVQSTAIRSASPVSTLYDASMKTARVLRSLISIVGSYALKGSVWALSPEMKTVDGCKMRRSGVEL